MKKIPIFTQVKNTSNNDKLLTASGQGLDSPVTEKDNRCIELGIDPWTNLIPNFRIHIVTTAKGLHHYTENDKFRKLMSLGAIEVFNIKALREEFDNNKPFWNNSYEMVSEGQPGVGNGEILHTCQNQDLYWPELFKDCSGILEFNRRLEKRIQSLIEEDGIDIKTYDAPHRFGDGLEIFTVCMYRLNENNLRFGNVDYK